MVHGYVSRRNLVELRADDANAPEDELPVEKEAHAEKLLCIGTTVEAACVEER